MKNPYNVLNVSENASDEEIKEAYRVLARKYQSDAYSSGPLAEIASRKMRELDEAYDEIILARRSSGSRSSSQSSSHGKARKKQSRNTSASSFSDIREKISMNRIDDAETLLDGVPQSMRNAEWYFLKGTVQYRRGWFEEAQNNFVIAVGMEPENAEYKAALNRITNPHGRGYRTRSNGSSGCSSCDICSSLICADCCCECFGGDLIPCC